MTRIKFYMIEFETNVGQLGFFWIAEANKKAARKFFLEQFPRLKLRNIECMTMGGVR